MILSFGFFAVLFVGGIWLLGIAHELPEWQAAVFVAGILLICISLAFVMRASGSATRRGADQRY